MSGQDHTALLSTLLFALGTSISGCHREPTCEPPGEWINGLCVFPCPAGACDGDTDADAAEGGSDVTGDTTVDAGGQSGLDATVDTGSDAAVCEEGFRVCEGSCVDIRTDPSHCGGCGLACPTVLNGRATCAMGACGFVCAAGYHRCGNQCVDDNSVMTCGERCEPCPVPANASRATCATGHCGFECNVGYEDCDGNSANGCETNTQVSPEHCGRCGNACRAPANATATCMAGRCGFVCHSGYAGNGDACVPLVAPRAIAPLSTAIVTSQRPVLRWALATGTDGARVELCRDRAMTRECQTIDVSGTSAMPTSALGPGVWFWRLRARTGGTTGVDTSSVWQFRVGVRSTLFATSWGTELDINGDGYTDIAVGAPGADNGRGRVEVYLSGPSGTAMTPSRTLWGSATYDNFGASVASAGDINGDGFVDLLVGAPLADPGGRTNAGTVTVYLGSASGLNPSPHRVLEGSTVDEFFGAAVASAGDVNGDGFGDIVVGARLADPGGRTNAGTVTVYLGSASGLNSSPHRVLEGSAAYDNFGAAVASAGDVNGDGFADVIVGARSASPGGRREAGTIAVYLGSASGLNSSPHRVLEGSAAYDNFGAAVASAGDLNGDGFADIVVGAPLADPSGLTEAGTASVYLGSASGLSPSPHRVLEGSAAYDNFGTAVASAGDVNGDGYADMVFGASRASPSGRREAGVVAVYLGSASGLSPSPHRVLEGSAAYDNFGTAVASAGDVNGDGFADLIIGAPRADPGGRVSAGTAMLYQGSGSGIGMSASRVLNGTSEGEWFGTSVTGAVW